MTPKPYKENKSQLRQFLEKKNLAPVSKEMQGKIAKNIGKNKYYTWLEEVALRGKEEDWARLEAVGWVPSSLPNKELNRKQWNDVQHMRQNDGWHDPAQLWYGMFILAGGVSPIRKQKGYYVAGRHYESKEAFMLSRTGLGKELL